MKKQLEKELHDLAQSILSSKDIDLPNLKKRTEKLLEKVSILNFVEKYYQSMGSSEDRLQYTMKKVSDFIEDEQDEDDIFNLPVKTTQVQQIVISQNEKKATETKVQSVTEQPQQDSTTQEDFSQQPERKSTHSTVSESEQNSAYKAYQDIIHKQQKTEHHPSDKQTINEKYQSEVKQETVQKPHQGQPLEDFISQTQHPVFEKKEESEVKTASLNDRLGKTAQIGLNDRLAFIRQLFFGSESEYNTVVQHINNLQSVQDIAIYIEQEIKPIYNHWRGKEDYEERFLSLMLKRFEV